MILCTVVCQNMQKIQQLPDLPTITPRDEMLIKRRRQLDLALNSSPYYIEKPKAKTEGVVAEIERYSDRYRVNIRANRPPLSSVLKLAPAYFPVELLVQGLHCCSPFSVG
jgi:hypothetical protein